jgi:ubiquinone/menaquinone biosynthesis C-methylase UbiE
MTLEAFFNRKIKGTISRWFGIKFATRSETSKVRPLVLQYCSGKGCDIGFGGDKIKQDDCDGIDFSQPYAKVGYNKVDIACDVIKDEIPVPDGTYDYVYTSHLIEDFTDTKSGLKKFIRILKSGGNLILAFPDQQKYEAYCEKTGQTPNPYHVHRNMGFDYMIAQLGEIENIRYEILFSSNCEIDYNVILVLKVIKTV